MEAVRYRHAFPDLFRDTGITAAREALETIARFARDVFRFRRCYNDDRAMMFHASAWYPMETASGAGRYGASRARLVANDGSGIMRRWLPGVLPGMLIAMGIVAAGPADARIVSVEIESSVPFAGGRDFGAGAYLRITGRARGEIDPVDARNTVIADLDRAPRNAAGRVEYTTPFVILRPADPARGSGRLVHEVTNRGRKLFFSYLYDAAGLSVAALNTLDDASSVGLALPLAAGDSLVWNGWDPAAPRRDGNLVLEAPVLLGLTGIVREEFVEIGRAHV